MPAGFQTWARGHIDEIQGRYTEIEGSSRAAFEAIMATNPPDMATNPPDQTTFALAATRQPHSAILFRLYDGTPFDDVLWKLVRPGPADPFRAEV
ncbi:MAG: hypothetical protein IT306_24640 [Chloroflexi bacterium]|nr:hypothetical protein [Chloroflexota bacterium]